VDRRGVEPRLPGCKPSVLPLNEQPFSPEVRPGIEPGLRPYQGRVLPEHLQTVASVFPGGVEPPISWMSTRRRGRWTTGSFHVSDRGGRRTHKITRPSTWSLYQGLRTRPRSSSPSVSCGGRNRTCDVTLNRRLPVPTQAPPQSKSGRPDLNRGYRRAAWVARAPEARGIPGFPTSCWWRAPSGREERTSMARRQAAATSWALWLEADLAKNSEHREGVEPSSPLYGSGVLATRPPVQLFSGTSGARTRTRLVKSQGCCR
jgi:hypothetical protein